MAWNVKWHRLYHDWLPVLTFVAVIIWGLTLRVSVPIGSYIAVLTFLAALVTIWPPERNVGKALWILVFGCLLLLELYNLNHDRSVHDQEQVKAREEERAAFQSIANGLNASIQQGQHSFDATMASMKGMIHTEESVLDQITGGHSYIYLDMETTLKPDYWAAGDRVRCNTALHFVGTAPLHNLHVTIFPGVGGGSMFDYDYGTLAPVALGKPILQPGLEFHLGSNKTAEFFVTISALNGNFFQVIILQRVDDKWLRATRLWKGGRASLRPGLYTWIEPGFPVGPNGQVDWLHSYR